MINSILYTPKLMFEGNAAFFKKKRKKNILDTTNNFDTSTPERWEDAIFQSYVFKAV